MVGFTPEKQRRLFAVLSAVLLLGNITYLNYEFLQYSIYFVT